MARVRLLTDAITRERYFLEPVTGIKFRRMLGAIVWPYGELDGCAVVLGETCSRQNIVGVRRHDLHKMEEYQSNSPTGLVYKLGLMTNDWMIRNWATPLCDQRAYLIEDANDELRKQRRHVMRYGDPLGWSGKGEGLLLFYHALVQRRTENEKTLFLGADSQCAAEIGKLKFEDARMSILERPSAAALCFAVAEIDLNVKTEWGAGRFDGESFGPADEMGGY